MRLLFSRYRCWFDIIFLAAIFWVARYFLSSQFGLYEDDITRIPDAFSMRLGDVWDHLVFLMTRDYANRPLHEGFIYILSWIGWQVNGLWGTYWIGYLITVVNIGLFYLLLTRLHSRLLGLLGGIAYALFSADTTQAYLTMSLEDNYPIHFCCWHSTHTFLVHVGCHISLSTRLFCSPTKHRFWFS